LTPVTDQGVSKDRYSVIPRTLIFLTRGDSVLLLKGSPTKRLWANQYNGVGGHIEPGEDVLTSARREFCEETGLEPDSLWLCGVVIVDTGQNPGIGIYVLRGECNTGEPLLSKEGALEWISTKDLARIRMVEDLPVLLPHVLNMQPGDPPFSALYTYDPNGKLLIRFG
jgi:8-oxo-dGTP diphosphatase